MRSSRIICRPISGPDQIVPIVVFALAMALGCGPLLAVAIAVVVTLVAAAAGPSRRGPWIE